MLFFSNPKRFEEYKDFNMKSHKTICTSNIDGDNIDYFIDYFGIAAEHDEISDNCGTLILRLLRNLNVKRIFLAGFDGFVNNTPNYIDGYFKEFYGATSFDNKKNAIEIKRVSEEVAIEFITPSIYETVQ